MKKIFVTFSAIAFMALLAGCSENKDEEKIRAEIATKTDIPDIWVSAIIDENKEKRHYPKVEVINDAMTITYQLDHDAEFSKNKDTVWKFEYAAKKIIKSGFKKFPQINSIEIIATMILVDQRGNEGRQSVIKTMFYRNNAGTINWENFQAENISNVADSWWIHSALL